MNLNKKCCARWSSHALCAVNHTLQNSPGEIAFRRDMFVDVLIIADLQAIQNRRQLLIDQNLIRMNRKRHDYHFRVGDRIMIRKTNNNKKTSQRIPAPVGIHWETVFLSALCFLL